MTYLTSLPFEIRDLIRRLPNAIINEIEITSYEISTLNMVQLANTLSNYTFDLNDEIQRYVYSGLMCIAENYEELYHKLPEPITPIDVLWKWVAYLNTFVINSANSEKFTEIFKEMEGFIADHIFVLIKSYVNIKEPEKDPIDILIDFQNKYPEFILNNILLYNLLIMSFSVNLYSSGEKVLPIQKMFDQFVLHSNAPFIESNCHRFNSMIYYTLGHMDKVLEFHEKYFKLAEKLGIKNKVILQKNNLAITYIKLGRYEEALTILDEIINLEVRGKATFLLNRSSIFAALENYDDAVNDIKAAMSINTKNPIIGFHSYLIHYLIKKDDIEEARKVYEDAKRIIEAHPLEINKTIQHHIEAEFHRATGDFSLAISSYEKVIEKLLQIGDISRLHNAYTEMISTQIELFSLRPNNTQVKQKLFSQINSLLILMDEGGSTVNTIEALIISGQVHLIDNNRVEAEKEFKNAIKLANKFEFHILEEKARKELEIIADKDKKSLLTRLRNSLKNMMVSTTKHVPQDYKLHGLMILDSSGLSLYNQYYSDLLESEPALISGLITAINAFIGDLAKGKGLLQSIKHDDLSLILEPIDQFVVLCIVSNETFESRELTRKFASQLSTIFEEYTEDLAVFKITSDMEFKINQIANNVYKIKIDQ
ncbi:MAG: hypothetical protein OEY49_14535 [Candidatus Heimdallarchaeota archaeon]|nr:hypothetical protein [Candidatus Heimdallarchaeota archaeon]